MQYFDNPNESLFGALASLLAGLVPRSRPHEKREFEALDGFLALLIECPVERKNLLLNALKTRSATLAPAAAISTLRATLKDCSRERFVRDLCELAIKLRGHGGFDAQGLSSLSLLLGVNYNATKHIIDELQAKPAPRIT